MIARRALDRAGVAMEGAELGAGADVGEMGLGEDSGPVGVGAAVARIHWRG